MREIDCDTASRALSARLDGEPPTMPEALEAHLASCAACRREAAEALEVAELLEGASRRRPESPELWPAIECRLPRPQGRRAVAAGIAILVLVATRWLETAPLSLEAIGLKLLPLAIAAAILAALRESPARLPTEFSAP